MEAVVRLDGAVAIALEKLVDFGYFRTKSEALRAGLLRLANDYDLLSDRHELEDELAIKKMQRIDSDIRSGKIKLMSKEQALKKYKRELGL